jgi:hypothetical protein
MPTIHPLIPGTLIGFDEFEDRTDLTDYKWSQEIVVPSKPTDLTPASGTLQGGFTPPERGPRPPVTFSTIRTGAHPKHWPAYVRATGLPGLPAKGISVFGCDANAPLHSSTPLFSATDGAVQVVFDRPRHYIPVWARAVLKGDSTQEVSNKPVIEAWTAPYVSQINQGAFIYNSLYPVEHGKTEWDSWNRISIYVPNGIPALRMYCQTASGETVVTIFSHFFFSDA